MVMLSNSLISIYDSKSLVEIRSLQVPNVIAASLSPCGTYVQTFQKSTTPQDKNVVLWRTDTGESVYQVFQKNMTKATWPSVRFSSDEAVACRLITNEAQFFDTKDLCKGIVHRLRVPGIAAFELSNTPGSYVAAFVPESKGMPANVQIFACAKELQSQPVARKSFFRCSSVQLKCNSGSTGLLVVVQSDVDKTNQSYYGESKLNYLTTDGSYEGLVPLRKEGPVHDVQWSYSGKEFAVVYGFMPVMATIFDKKCNPLLELRTGPYYTIRWKPKGKFICVAGFGNLPGDMAFWDYLEKKKLATTKAELSVTSEWSPDGRYFMTATTAPRLQVDNGIKIFHHNGSLFFKKMYDKLFQVDWKLESPAKFGDIQELLKSVDSLVLEETAKQGKGLKAGQGSKAAAQKLAAYRPPHAKAAAVVQAEDNATKIPIWVTLPGLPLEWWTATILSKIGTKVGTPICTDEITKTRIRIAYAWILVEVDISKPLVRFVKICGPDGEFYNQPIFFEAVPPFCLDCNVIGHGPTKCPSPKDTSPKAAAPAKKAEKPSTAMQAAEKVASISKLRAKHQAVPEAVAERAQHQQHALESDPPFTVVRRKSRMAKKGAFFVSMGTAARPPNLSIKRLGA